jgi:6-pyruvoyltetrahydropterin/6-carboxytetrahydropterin synthase
MHKLSRQVRFSVNPFLSQQMEGYNSFASKPTGQGLSFFLELVVELAGDIEPKTGFIVNVTDIDRIVRQFAVPVFIEQITRGKYIGFFTLAELLGAAWVKLKEQFSPARLNKLSLKLSPFRTIAIKAEVFDMVYFSEKFEFAATHKLWNTQFSEQKNMEIFGKCANPTGHGHNYTIEVTVKMPPGRDDFNVCDFEQVVDRELIKIVDHKNLNLDVEYFKNHNPTVENITSFAWQRLSGKMSPGLLYCITIWETDKTSCSYYGG